jgi:soluble lytic murein transglycosylase-like protein
MKTHSPITSKRGILVGRPLAGAMFLAWMLSLVGFVNLLQQNQQLAHMVQAQQDQLSTQGEQVAHLQQRLHILEAVEELQSNLTPDEEAALAHQVFDYSHEHGLDPLLVLSVIRVESDFASDAVSPMGALGIMQVMPATARFVTEQRGWNWPGESRLFEPSFNIRVATSYLSDLLTKFGSVEEALIAYNCGEGTMQELASIGLPLPRSYARRVLSVYDRLQRRYGTADSELSPPLHND